LDHSHLKEAFAEFASQIKEDGFLLLKKGVKISLEGVKAKILTYSYDTPADFYASDIVPLDGGYFDFSLNTPEGKIEKCTLGIPGWVNVENAVAASAAALLHGITPEKLRSGLAGFRGVARRFDIRINTPQCAYVDDYAHHPNELRHAISSMRGIFKGKRLCGIFQPHLYSRTRDFAEEFADALGGLDELILLHIYPARELPIEGVTSKIIFDKVRLENKILINKEELMETLRRRNFECLITFGAGDIDRFVLPIEEELKARIGK
jgi:UDP-N-acetylmuramate--alanine ligase